MRIIEPKTKQTKSSEVKETLYFLAILIMSTLIYIGVAS
jgi:hypothetical protein